ncbi:hypothetical protein LCI18_010323 [Fusarium solani-melongenae]|uniref:Uncharacterized protein n=1 Tax=Fusarium solani subsp. cucurbitae TaxID=2747967 RepID=A0ACD3ZE82_FUSSC|nr:hypothetical protein LCI18_010323 [Fusarium solani-melongenae]
MSLCRAGSLPAALLSSGTASHRLNGCCHRSLYAIAARPRRRDHLRSISGRRAYTTEPKDADIAVLGGGLTGLSAAYYLAKKLPSTANITLYESSDRLGGWIKTDRVPVDVGGKQGVVLFERGARSLTSLAGNTFRYDDLVLYDLALDLGLKISSPGSKPRYIYYPDHLVTMPPFAPFADFLREPLFLQSFWAGLALAFNTLRRRHLPAQDYSVAEWLYKITNSRKAVGTMASAMMHGIYGGDINKLSARSVLDRIYWGWYLPNPGLHARPMPMPEKEILEALGKDKEIQKLALSPKNALVDFGEAGMETLPRAMADALRSQPNVTIKTGEDVWGLTYDQKTKKIEIASSKASEQPQRFDKVISTLSSQDTANLAPSKLRAFSKAHSVSIMRVNLWFPQENIKPPGLGYLIPNTVAPEMNPEHALGVFFDSDVQVRSADEPAGTKLFVLMGGHYYDEPGAKIPSEDEAIIQARSLLERHLGIPRDAPCHAVAGLAKNCIPQHNVGHQDLLRDAHRELCTHFEGRLAVAGGSYGRIGAIASLRAGYDAALSTKSGLENTGLEYLNQLQDFAVVPIEKIPVRRFK